MCSLRTDTKRPNNPDAQNAAVALWFHAGRQWRGVCDPCRSMLEPSSSILDEDC